MDYNSNNYKLLGLQISTVENLNKIYQEELNNLNRTLLETEQVSQENLAAIENLKHQFLLKKQEFARRKLRIEHRLESCSGLQGSS